MGFETILLTIIAGIFVGIIAGLFGVGGGIIVVPVLTFIFRKLGFSDSIIAHSALGTSLATIFFTSFSSLLSHHKKNFVLWKVLWILIPGIVLGSYGGSYFASLLKSKYLILIFIIFVFVFSIKTFYSTIKKNSSDPIDSEVFSIPTDKHDIEPNQQKYNPTEFKLDTLRNQNYNSEKDNSFSLHLLPSKLYQLFFGCLIGFSSSLVGVGGGVFTTSYLLHFRTPIHLAIGTSSAIGFPIAIAGSIGYMFNGWNNPLLPSGSFGFIYIPALFGIVVGSIPFAFLGARLSHRLNKNILKRLFAIFLMCMGLMMILF